MRKLLLMIALVIGLPMLSLSQGLNEDYTTVYEKVKKGKFTDMTFNTNNDRKWINATSELGWNSFGFPLDGNVCDVVILTPYSREGVVEMVKYCNTNLIIIDSHNWNIYRQDGTLGRVTLKSIDNYLVFYFYNL